MMLPDYDNAMKWLGFLKEAYISILLFGLLAFIVFLIIFYPEKIFYLSSKIQMLFLWVSKGIRRKQIENEINGNLLKASKDVCKEINDVMPYKLKINWVSNTTRESFFDGKNVVVCVDNKRNKLYTIVHAISEYVNNGLLEKEKACLDKSVVKSSCIVMTRKLLMSSYQKGMSYFIEEIVNKELKSDDELITLIDKMICLDENGMFVQIMIREIKEKSKKVFGKVNNNLFINETKEFIKFLHNIASRRMGAPDVPLKFIRTYYKSAILIVANSENYFYNGLEAYIKRFKQNALEGAEIVYICARNRKRRLAEKVLLEVEKIGLVKEHNSFSFKGINPDGINYKGLCIEVKLNKEKASVIKKIS